jgi:hypothetical protein
VRSSTRTPPAIANARLRRMLSLRLAGALTLKSTGTGSQLQRACH